MSPIKDTMSNLFSKNKKNGKEGSSELEKEFGIQEETEHEARIKNESKSEGEGEHETELQNETTVQDYIDTDPEWEKRVLCSDGNCIGVIGPDGRCKECGKTYDGTDQIYDHDDTDQKISETPPPDEGLGSAEEDLFSEDSEEVNNSSDDSGTATDSDPESEWDKRILCSDGNCIGVIGPDGRCKECGKPYQG
jgi:hypothetical protein